MNWKKIALLIALIGIGIVLAGCWIFFRPTLVDFTETKGILLDEDQKPISGANVYVGYTCMRSVLADSAQVDVLHYERVVTDIVGRFIAPAYSEGLRFDGFLFGCDKRFKAQTNQWHCIEIQNKDPNVFRLTRNSGIETWDCLGSTPTSYDLFHNTVGVAAAPKDYPDDIVIAIADSKLRQRQADARKGETYVEWEKANLQEFFEIIPYPPSWTASDGTSEGEILIFRDEGGGIAATVQCPIPEVGFEAWDFEVSTETYLMHGFEHGKTLWLGKEKTDGFGDMNILFAHLNAFNRLFEDGYFRYSCMVSSTQHREILKEMYNRMEWAHSEAHLPDGTSSQRETQ